MRVLVIAHTNFEIEVLTSIALGVIAAAPETVFDLYVGSRVKNRIAPEHSRVFKNIYVSEFAHAYRFLWIKSLSQLPLLPYRYIQFFYKTLVFLFGLKRAVPWEEIDTVLSTSFREYYMNVLIKHIPRHIKLITIRLADHAADDECTKKHWLNSFSCNLFNRLFAYSCMEYRWHTTMPAMYAYKYIRNPYHKSIAISDGKTSPSLREREVLLRAPLVFLRKLFPAEAKQPAKRILVIGERTPVTANWSGDTTDAAWTSPEHLRYQAFLDMLAEKYKGYELYFTPRKHLTILNRLQLDRYILLSEDSSLERLFSTMSFEKVISIKSTGCKSASFFGYPSYVIYPLLGLNAGMEDVLRGFFRACDFIVPVYAFEDLERVTQDPIDEHLLATQFAEAVLG